MEVTENDIARTPLWRVFVARVSVGGGAHTRVMSEHGVAVPGWVVPAGTAVADLMWLSYGSWVESGSQWTAGVLNTALWVRGGGAAPLTERVDVPVTRAMAEAEWLACLELDTEPGEDGPPAEAECARLGVAYLPPRAGDRVVARGVEATLRWLLGRSGVRGPAAPPMELPTRDADGSIPPAQELYEAVLATAGRCGPEERAKLRLAAEVDVARSVRLDADIARAKATSSREQARQPRV